MRKPSLSPTHSLEPRPEPPRAPYDYYDDENEADYDDGEDDAVAIAVAHPRWSARAGFGSPEWWSR